MFKAKVWVFEQGAGFISLVKNVGRFLTGYGLTRILVVQFFLCLYVQFWVCEVIQAIAGFVPIGFYGLALFYQFAGMVSLEVQV